ncbi:GNAT family N-acetyltransferase [Orenia marismortui]|uniref:Ribosomal-protein-alanine N-acetyltransferase n=1 Tax=Orenia marismortui TaxID=46469 RepID=A0A4R8GXT8_9FIRM|nr:N-acetyltransferase [Orenia marismortui]TDX51059.1 ribosomal-protein-alanine N-acetyltransferase [Orenia marismortui]
MGISIKELTANNSSVINKLIAIESEAFGEGGLNYWGIVPMIYHGAVYVIFMDKEPVGLVEYMRDIRQSTTAYLYGLAIEKEYRKQGLATKLLEYSLAKISKQGIQKVELTVDPNNESAIYLYQNKFGFKEVEYRKNEYGIGEDRLIMELEF